MKKKSKKLTLKQLMAKGFNPAAKTGNASGVYPPRKGKGSKYVRHNKPIFDETI